MKNKKEIQNKEEEKITPEGTDQANEEITSDNTNDGADEVVSLSKKELETLKKKAEDFERSIELRRLAKLERQAKEKEGQGEAKADEIASLQSQIAELKEMVAIGQTTQRNLILRDAYREFIDDNKWADNDEIFAKISENFKSDNVTSKDDAIKQLKIIAATQFPNEYESHISAKAKAQALAEASNIKTGSGSSGGGVNPQAKGDMSEEEKMSAKFMKNFPPGWAINNKLNK